MESRRVFFVAQLFCLAKTSVKGESIQNHLSNEKRQPQNGYLGYGLGMKKSYPVI